MEIKNTIKKDEKEMVTVKGIGSARMGWSRIFRWSVFIVFVEIHWKLFLLHIQLDCDC